MDVKYHWNRVYTNKSDEQISWFEPLPAVSVQMLKAAGMTPESCVVDVGGGDSRLVDYLVAQGLECVAVLDVSGAALARAKARIGSRADPLMWIESDVAASWTLKPMDIWHDRAVFHFLTEAHARERYREHLVEVLKPGGSAIIATFAPDGPEKCSGLPVARYSPEALASELGPALRLIESQAHTHKTPWGTTQSFQYSRFVKS
jgi:trans-aconitate methyltransferase